MTIVNKKSSPVRFDKSVHYTAHDTVSFPKTGRTDGGDRSGLVRQEGGLYLLRLKRCPHLAQWVTFKKGGDS